MPKCFLTGIEIDLESACLLDRGAALRAVRSLKQRLAAVDRLVTHLGAKDEVEMFDPQSRKTRKHSQRRLVCQTVAAALSASYPESPLFVTWREFTARRPPVFPEFGGESGHAEECKEQQPGKEPEVLLTSENSRAASE